MRRVDQIRTMSAYEMADWMIGAGIDERIGFCQNKKECADYMDEHEVLPPDGCRECLIKWLEGVGEL